MNEQEKEVCKRCKKEDSDGDLRTLYMACFYDMSELNIPFELQIVTNDKKDFYTLLVCKTCRAEWMRYIKMWFSLHFVSILTPEEPGSGIFIRELGAIREVSEEVFKTLNPGKEPVRFIQTTKGEGNDGK